MALGYVRTARPDEAGEIARIQLATWRTAYRRLLPRHVLDELDEDFLAQRWRAAIETPPSARHRVLVAVEQGESAYLVGFAATGPADDDALAPGYFEVMAQTVGQFAEPDVIHCAAYHYCYPNVIPADPAGCLAIVLNQIATDPRESLTGLALVILGLPVYYFWRRAHARD